MAHNLKRSKMSIRAQTIYACGGNKRLVFLYVIKVKLKWKVIIIFCITLELTMKKTYNRYTKDEEKKQTNKSLQKIIQ